MKTPAAAWYRAKDLILKPSCANAGLRPTRVDKQLSRLMIAPFVLVEGQDVSLHPSLDALTSLVEAQDVRDGVYETFDAEGREVKLAAATDLSAVTAAPGDQAGDRLRAILIKYLDDIGADKIDFSETDVATLDLASLLSIVAAYQRGGRSPR